MSKVVILECTSYDYEKVLSCIQKGINLLGGIDKFASKDEKILLKPNFLSADKAEKCSTTHPMVFKAVAEEFLKSGTKITYGDSPGLHKPLSVAKKNGTFDITNELGIEMADFESGKEISYAGGVQNKRFFIANGVLDSDGIISISKFKTHGLTRFTGAIKNQFGCIPGKLKGEFHAKIPDVINFSKMLIDLNKYLKPRLYVMDGIVAMEGNGPRNGTPRQMNVILLSTDPVALDATACRMIDLNPEFVPTNDMGMKLKLGTYHEEQIELLGDDIKKFIKTDFNVSKKPVKPYKKGFVINAIQNTFVPKPKIENEKCIKCGVCVEMCPVNPKAVTFPNDDKTQIPTYNYEHCIRCFCCQEMCPEGAIELKTPILRKIASNFKKKNK